MSAWLNGAVVGPDAAALLLDDRGFLLGDGVFDTLAAFNGKPFRLEDHLQRLRQNAGAIDLPVPYDDAALGQAVLAVLKAGPAEKVVAVRTTVSRGPGPRGLLPPKTDVCRPVVMIAAAVFAPPDSPAKAIISSVRRNEGALTSRIKSLSYLDNILARQEAARHGADEAIMLNNRGVVAGATAANIFIVRNKTLFTPPVEDGVLAGIARKAVFEMAATLGLSAHETSLAPEKLYEADDVFLASSLIGVRSVGQIGEHIVRDSGPGSVVLSLQESWRALTGS